MDAGLILHAFYRVESGVDLSTWLQDYQGMGGWVGWSWLLHGRLLVMRAVDST